jgi:hypothetical protein
MPTEKVQAFEKPLSPYKSFLWPIGMLQPFVNVHNILQGNVGWGTADRLMILGRDNDKLMTTGIMHRVADTHCSAFRDLVESKRIEAKCEQSRAQGKDDFGDGVRFTIALSAGHRMQIDEPWAIGAKKILSFYEQL